MDNKQYAKEFIEYLWNNGDESVLDSYLSQILKCTDRWQIGSERIERPLENGFATSRVYHRTFVFGP